MWGLPAQFQSACGGPGGRVYNTGADVPVLPDTGKVYAAGACIHGGWGSVALSPADTAQSPGFLQRCVSAAGSDLWLQLKEPQNSAGEAPGCGLQSCVILET